MSLKCNLRLQKKALSSVWVSVENDMSQEHCTTAKSHLYESKVLSFAPAFKDDVCNKTAQKTLKKGNETTLKLLRPFSTAH